jgi:hypothetical protein
MKANESGLDRESELSWEQFFWCSFCGHFGRTLGIIGLVVGAILVLTGLIGFCPLYALLKFRTNKA